MTFEPADSATPAPVERPRLLLLDDAIPFGEILIRGLGAQGYACDRCENGADALNLLGSGRYDLLLAGEQRMGGAWDSFLLEAERRCPDIAVILLASEGNVEHAVASLKSGAYDYILKPCAPEEVCLSVGRAIEKRRLLIQNREYQRNLEEQVADRIRQLREALGILRHTYYSTLLALGTALDNREIDNDGHSLRVTLYSLRLARQIGLPAAEAEILEQGALLHDIGKLGVPDAVLRKGGNLEPADWALMKRHPEIGFRILSGIDYLADAARLVLQHHERYDGSGYPAGLKGDAIQLPARVFAVADVFDGMTTDHPYRPALTIEAARVAIRGLSRTQLDPEFVDAFLAVPSGDWEQIRSEARSRLRGGFLMRAPAQV